MIQTNEYFQQTTDKMEKVTEEGLLQQMMEERIQQKRQELMQKVGLVTSTSEVAEGSSRPTNQYKTSMLERMKEEVMRESSNTREEASTSENVRDTSPVPLMKAKTGPKLTMAPIQEVTRKNRNMTRKEQPAVDQTAYDTFKPKEEAKVITERLLSLIHI